jgi:predicted nucleic acid-binding protein
LSWESGERLYVDTNLFIYAVEEVAPFASQVKPLLQAADAGTVTLVTSLLTLAETLVMPYRLENKDLISAYRNLFTTPHPNLIVLPPNAAILEKAAQLRAAIPTLFLPDAIHLATAQVGECDQFFTNDERLKAAAAPTVVLLRD